METIKLVSKYKSFNGWTEFYSHDSQSTQTLMKFSVYRPPQAESSKVPVLYWLSGLTCTEENFMIKSGAQKRASQLGLMIVACDTSPRGANIPGEDQDWDFGTGAGFYLDATQAPWSKNYKMESYVVRELPKLIEANFPVIAELKSISGHSMGGHGALTLALRHPSEYKSVSAFSPIAAPRLCPWGKKAFTNYLGANEEEWKQHDTSWLVANGKTKIPFIVDQGGSDSFLKEQLRFDELKKACQQSGYPAELRLHENYDHSYYFVSSFIDEHLDYHARLLK